MKKTAMLAVGVFLPAVFLLAMLTPAVAAAADYWTAPVASGGCTSESDPCGLETAVADAIGAGGGRVILEPGSGPYTPAAQIYIAAPIDIGGEPGAATPTVDTKGAGGLVIQNPDASVHDLRIEKSTAGSSAFQLLRGTAERVYVSLSSPGAGACLVGQGALLRDSVCSATSSAANTAGVDSENAGSSTLRNVTAVAAGAGSAGVQVTSSSTATPLDAVNVIARGTLDDARATDAGGVATITFSHSNYAVPTHTGGGASITPVGTSGNQAAAPLFANAASGDFHELAGSPTIDAGISDPSIGLLDLDKNPRTALSCLGGALGIPDIGAYEKPPPVPACGMFTLGALRRNKKKGTAKLTVTVPGSGALSLSGKGLKKSSATAAAAGNDILTLKTTGKAKHKLAAKGKAKLKATIMFTPTGGAAATQSETVKLIKK
jgi:hypothetical protein